MKPEPLSIRNNAPDGSSYSSHKSIYDNTNESIMSVSQKFSAILGFALAHTWGEAHTLAPSTNEPQHSGVTVEQVTQDSFDTFLAQHDLVLASFCSRRSGICQYLDVEINEFAALAEEDGLSFGVAEVDCSTHKQLCAEHNVQAYPTLRWYKEGRGNEDTFHGLLIAKELLELANMETGNAPVEVAVATSGSGQTQTGHLRATATGAAQYRAPRVASGAFGSGPISWN